MSIKPIDDLCLLTHLESESMEGPRANINKPMIVLMRNDKNATIIAAIYITLREEAWHVTNVVAKNGYGPTIYKVLMILSGKNGIAPSYKTSKNKPDFIVVKSKNIWKEFSKSYHVKRTFLCDKYDDNYLNFKFECVNHELELSINLAKRNLKSHIKEKFNSQRSYKQKILAFFKCKGEMSDYKNFRIEYRSTLFTKATAFLMESVHVHR